MFKKKCGLSFAKAARWYKSFSEMRKQKKLLLINLTFFLEIDYVFSSNRHFSNFFIKNVTFTKFLPKMRETKVSTATIKQCGKTRNSLSFTEKKFNRIIYSVISLVKPLLSRNFCEDEIKFLQIHEINKNLKQTVQMYELWRWRPTSNTITNYVLTFVLALICVLW